MVQDKLVGRSENAAFANYSVFFVLHLVVFLVTFHEVDVTNASLLVHFVSKGDLVSLHTSNCVTSRVSTVYWLLYNIYLLTL